MQTSTASYQREAEKSTFSVNNHANPGELFFETLLGFADSIGMPGIKIDKLAINFYIITKTCKEIM